MAVRTSLRVFRSSLSMVAVLSTLTLLLACQNGNGGANPPVCPQSIQGTQIGVSVICGTPSSIPSSGSATPSPAPSCAMWALTGGGACVATGSSPLPSSPPAACMIPEGCSPPPSSPSPSPAAPSPAPSCLMWALVNGGGPCVATGSSPFPSQSP